LLLIAWKKKEEYLGRKRTRRKRTEKEKKPGTVTIADLEVISKKTREWTKDRATGKEGSQLTNQLISVEKGTGLSLQEKRKKEHKEEVPNAQMTRRVKEVSTGNISSSRKRPHPISRQKETGASGGIATLSEDKRVMSRPKRKKKRISEIRMGRRRGKRGVGVSHATAENQAARNRRSKREEKKKERGSKRSLIC